MPTPWEGFTDVSIIEDGDVLLATRGGAGINPPGSCLVKKDSSGFVGIGGPAVKQFCLKGTGGTGIEMTAQEGDFGRILAYNRVDSLYIPLNLEASTINFKIGTSTVGFFHTTGSFLPGTDGAQSIGSAGYRWNTIFAATGSINTSDEREKTDIGEIPDDWLDAWGRVEWSRFKIVGRTRWHAGLVAQRVHKAFADAGLDAFDIGLCCFDEWAEQRDPIYKEVTRKRNVTKMRMVEDGKSEQGKTLFKIEQLDAEEDYKEFVDTGRTRVAKPAGDRWGLRYDECFAMEAAWNRRERARDATAREALEERLAKLEAAA